MITTIVLLILAVVTIMAGVTIVPNQYAIVVERLGRYHSTLTAGFHVLIPFIDRKAYRRSLKEEVYDVAAQTCITADNVTVTIDGVIYLQVVDAMKSAYGIEGYVDGAIQLAQTSLRSAIGRMPLEKTFESRDEINQEVCSDLNKATAAWGVKVLRYEMAFFLRGDEADEIRDLQPPKSITDAMERQVKAEREKRAVVLQSEGTKQSQINIAEGQKEAAIATSEGEKQAQINHAEGQAAQILRVAEATAEGLRMLREQLNGDALAAAQLKLSEQYIQQFGNIAKTNNTVIIPADMANVGSLVGAVTGMLGKGRGLNAYLQDSADTKKS